MTKRLPRIPATVWSQGGPVAVRRVKKLKDEDGTLLDGLWCPESREIRLSAELTSNAAWHVLAHEVAHAWLDDGGFRGTTPAVLERIADAVACGVVLNLWNQR